MKVNRNSGFSKTESGVIEIEVRDKDGNIVTKRVEKMNSWLYNYYQLVRPGLIKGINNLLIKDTDGNSITVNSISFQDGANAPEGDDSYGIVVGSGSTNVDVLHDYNLANKISNGTGSGQLQYGSTSFQEDTSNPPKLTLIVKRTFINNSGDSVTVNEIGLVLKLSYDGGTANVMVVRDVITATTVPNGGTLAVTYKLNVN